MQILAPAKVNLSLHILNRREDGYHNLQSLVGFADFGDEITLTPSNIMKVEFQGEFAKGLNPKNNSLLDAFEFLKKNANIEQNFHINVKKNIPFMAGLGGGSSDCAAILRALRPKLGAQSENWSKALPLGADVPICLAQRTAIMEGVGEIIRPVTIDAPLFAILINPNIHLSTGQIFDNLTAYCREFPSKSLYHADDIKAMENTMEHAAFALAPQLSEIFQEISKTGAWVTRMTGSGSTIFGLYESAAKRDIAYKTLQARYPKFWIKPTQIARDMT